MKRTSGVGLTNVKRRLDHLYPNRHSLQRFDELDTHMAVLRISLHESVSQPSLSETTIL
jgi:sensor histidine kinase YesM